MSLFELTEPHIIYALFGTFVCLFGFLSLFIKERLYIGESVVSTLFGIIIGPACIGIFDPLAWSSKDVITLEFTRVIVAIQVFAVGVELPNAYLRRHWLSLFIILVPVMGYGWLVSAALVTALIPRVTFLQSLAIAACVTPTDPILAAGIVGKGKYSQSHVPTHLRRLLSATSGINDGMAIPFLFISIFLLQNPDDPKSAVGKWFYLTWAYQIILGIAVGSIIGVISRKGVKFAERRNLIDKESFLVLYIGLALASVGSVSILGSDDLLASFCCGTAFAWDGWFSEKTDSSNFSDVVDLLLNQAIFIYIGATIPWDSMSDTQGLSLTPWRLGVLAICILLLRRIPAMIAFYPFMREIKNIGEALFAGHFGPIGVAAIFIATLAKHKLITSDSVEEGHQYVPGEEISGNLLVANLLQPVIYFLVLSSVVVHGTTIPLFYLGKRLNTITRSFTLETITRSRTREGNSLAWILSLRHFNNQGRVDVNSIGPPIFHGSMPSFDGRKEEGNGKTGSTEGERTAAASLDEKRDKEKIIGNLEIKGTYTITPGAPGTSGIGTPRIASIPSTPRIPGTPIRPGTPVPDVSVNIDMDDVEVLECDYERDDKQENQGTIYPEGYKMIVEEKDRDIRQTEDEEEQFGGDNIPSIRWDDSSEPNRHQEEEDSKRRSRHEGPIRNSLEDDKRRSWNERPKRQSLSRKNSSRGNGSNGSKLRRTRTEPYK